MKYLCFIVLGLACQYQEDPLDLTYHQRPLRKNAEKVERIYEKFESFSAQFPDADNIGVDEVDSFESPVFVDVREAAEMNLSTIKNAISKEYFFKNINKFSDRNLIVYCTIGYRSGIFANKLKKRGFKAYNLLGGVLMWSHDKRAFYRNDLVTKQVHVYARNWDLLHSDYQSVY